MVESLPLQVGDRWGWRCKVLVDGVQYIGSAEVHLNAKPGSADATDPLACAETSAVGRALGFAGVLSLDGIASADEIVRVQQQNGGNAEDIDPALQAIQGAVKELGLATNQEQWVAWKKQVLGAGIANKFLKPHQIAQLRRALEEHKRGVTAAA